MFQSAQNGRLPDRPATDLYRACRGIPACSIHTSPPVRYPSGGLQPCSPAVLASESRNRAVDSLRSPLRGACGVVSAIRSGSMPLNMSSPAPNLPVLGAANAKYIISKSRGPGNYLTFKERQRHPLSGVRYPVRPAWFSVYA